MIQRERTHGRVYQMTLEDVGAAPNIMADTLQIKSIQGYDLFDPWASQSFVSCQIINNLYMLLNRMDIRVTINTVLGENKDIDNVYKKVRLDAFELVLFWFDFVCELIICTSGINGLFHQNSDYLKGVWQESGI